MAVTGTNLIWDPVNEEDKVVADPAATKKSAVTESVHGDGEMTEDGIPSSVKGGSDCVIDVSEATGGKYNIRVLIPCYKEDADIVEKTIVAIRSAVLPPGERISEAQLTLAAECQAISPAVITMAILVTMGCIGHTQSCVLLQSWFPPRAGFRGVLILVM